MGVSARVLVSVLLLLSLLQLVVTQGVYSQQYATGADIAQLSAPATVTAGQSFTVSLSVTFVAQPPRQSLWVVLEDSSNNQLPATVSCPGSAGNSTCVYIPSPFQSMPATVTVGFTLTAPSSATTWSLKVSALVVQVGYSGNLQQVGTYSVKQFQVQVTGTQLQSASQSRSTAAPTTILSTTSTAFILTGTFSPTATLTMAPVTISARSDLWPLLLLILMVLAAIVLVFLLTRRSKPTNPKVTKPN